MSLFLPTIQDATDRKQVLKTDERGTTGEPTQSGTASSDPQAQSEPSSISVNGQEMEPNDSTGSANLIGIGASVVGEIRREDAVDVFRIDTKDHVGKTFYVTLTSDGASGLQVLQPTGQMIYHEMMGYGGSKTFEGPVEFESYIVRIAEGHGGASAKYEMLVTAR